MSDRSCTFLNPHNVVCCTECGLGLDLCPCVNPEEIAYHRLTSADGLVFIMVRDELKAARAQFPGNTHMFDALVEEVGELSKALMEHDRKQGTTVHQVLHEAVQSAAMCIRVAVEGDDNYLYEFPAVEEELPRGPVGGRFS